MADHPAPSPSLTSHLNHEKDANSPSLVDIDIQQNKSPQHDNETHGTSDVIDETTPVDAVKGPGVFQRVKEEVEAIVEAILPKKDSNDPK